ncbi:MAG: flagellar basal body P-ring protein FlgI [Desulfuromonadaceae bacterium]
MAGRIKYFIFLGLLATLMFCAPATAARIKDLATIEGVRDNQLYGYGLVVGLNGTGDGDGTEFTVQSLVNMMERLGVTVDRDEVKISNVAAVMVTATLPPFARAGSTLDVQVSSIGDASSLAGGTLLMTPLNGPDGNVYAVAQGALVVGSLAFGGKAAKVQTNHPTVGRIPGGALVEREVAFELGNPDALVYRLKNADFTTAARLNNAVNSRFGVAIAHPLDSGSIRIQVPEGYRGRTVAFIADLESIEVAPDQMARIVVNEKTGTIVMGEEVRISTVAVSHGNLNLVITDDDQVSQPNPLAQGETKVVPRTTVNVAEENGELVVLEKGVSIGDVARSLNAIGASPRDLIAIFQAIKAAGALYADLIIL